MTYLSFLKRNYNESEKIRFYSMSKKLITIKYFLEKDSPNKYNKLKSFLLKEGIFNKALIILLNLLKMKNRQ